MSAEPTEAPSELLLTVPRSSFDLLEGAAEDKGRSRILNAALLILVVAVVGTLASRGLLTRLDASSDRDAAAALAEQSKAITDELAARRRSGEVSKTALDAHIAERLAIVDSVAGPELAYARIIREIVALGPGITVDRITFGGSGDTAQAGTPATQPPAPPATSDGTASPTPTKSDSSITVSGTAVDAAVANAATTALSDPARFPYLTTGNPGAVSCGGASSGSGCTWTWNGTITDEGRNDRAEELRARVASTSEGGGN